LAAEAVGYKYGLIALGELRFKFEYAVKLGIHILSKNGSERYKFSNATMQSVLLVVGEHFTVSQ